MTRATPASGAAILRRTAPAAALALAVCIAVVGPVRFSPAILGLFLAAAAVRLGEGPHSIEVTLQNRSDYAQIFLSWIRPNRNREMVPAEVLRPPPLAPYPAGQVPPLPKSG